VMTPQAWKRLEELFEKALPLQGGERVRFVERACETPAQRAELLKLLAAHDSSGDFLETPAYRPVPPAAAAPDPPPARIGSCDIVRKLGSGGMGVVYEALQPTTGRRVAVKVIRTGTHLDPLAQRMFQREIHTLGRLDHPAIATIYDAGCTRDGVPYFVMELVDGLPLDQFIRRHRLNIRQRVALFAQICEAVGYAHRRGVLHRDIKPSNILVTQVPADDGNGSAVKILDFGLARLSDDGDGSLFASAPDRVVGTLAYMSPEQARGPLDRLDTRSDVYSLGVILYELLTDRRPHASEQRPIGEALVDLCEHDPPRPRSIRADLDRDLEAIALKALARDPEQRYGAAAALAEDVRRYLDGQPVVARPPSAWQSLRHLIWRHRWRAAAVGAFLAATTTSGIWMGALYVRAHRAERKAAARLAEAQAARVEAERQSREAQLEARRAGQVAEFLRYILASANPALGGRHDLTVHETLDRAVKLLDKGALSEPEVRATLQDAIGYSYFCLGHYEQARPLLDAAWRWRRDHLGPDHLDTLSSANNVAMLATTTGHYERAEQMFREIVAADRRVLGPDNPERAPALKNLAYVLQARGQFDEAERILREVLDLQRKSQSADPRDIARTLNAIAMLAGRAGRLDESIEQGRAALAAVEKAYGPDDLQVSLAANNLAVSLAQAGRFEEAEPLMNRALQIQRHVLGPRHPDLALTLTNMARAYCKAGKPDQAESFAREALQIRLELLGPDHPDTALSRVAVGLVQAGQGQREAARESFTTALSVLRRKLGPDHPDTRRIERLYASLHLDAGGPSSAPTRPTSAPAVPSSAPAGAIRPASETRSD